jgi:hypothetical protein
VPAEQETKVLQEVDGDAIIRNRAFVAHRCEADEPD